MVEVIVDVDLVKALIKSYNPITHGFHRKDMSLIYKLDSKTFIIVFYQGGPVTKPIELEKMNGTFNNQRSFFSGKVM